MLLLISSSFFIIFFWVFIFWGFKFFIIFSFIISFSDNSSSFSFKLSSFDFGEFVLLLFALGIVFIWDFIFFVFGLLWFLISSLLSFLLYGELSFFWFDFVFFNTLLLLLLLVKFFVFSDNYYLNYSYLKAFFLFLNSLWFSCIPFILISS